MNKDQKNAWYAHWICVTFEALEAQALKFQDIGGFCFGAQATMADVCLIPQIYNALRFKVNVANFPRLMEVYQHCNSLSAFQLAAPEVQKDAI